MTEIDTHCETDRQDYESDDDSSDSDSFHPFRSIAKRIKKWKIDEDSSDSDSFHPFRNIAKSNKGLENQ